MSDIYDAWVKYQPEDTDPHPGFVAGWLACLRAIEERGPAAFIDKRGFLYNKTTHPQSNTPLYRLPEYMQHE